MNQSDYSQIPATSPPPGQTSNFVDPPSQEVTMITVSVIMITLTLAFVHDLFLLFFPLLFRLDLLVVLRDSFLPSIHYSPNSPRITLSSILHHPFRLLRDTDLLQRFQSRLQA